MTIKLFFMCVERFVHWGTDIPHLLDSLVNDKLVSYNQKVYEAIQPNGKKTVPSTVFMFPCSPNYSIT